MSTQPLSTLPFGKRGTIQAVVPIQPKDPVAQRLTDLGFLSGETVKVIARTPFQTGPLVVKIGGTQFALRQTEAARILVIAERCQHENH